MSKSSVVVINGWELQREGGGEARISVKELAEKLGREAWRLRESVREVSQNSENFNPIEASAGGRGQSTEYTEFYLNESETLFLMTRLRGEIAEKITWSLIRVFIAARKGERQIHYGYENKRLPDGNVIGSGEAKLYINSPLGILAHKLAISKPEKTSAEHFRDLRNSIRDAIRFYGSWNALPRSNLDVVKKLVEHAYEKHTVLDSNAGGSEAASGQGSEEIEREDGVSVH